MGIIQIKTLKKRKLQKWSLMNLNLMYGSKKIASPGLPAQPLRLTVALSPGPLDALANLMASFPEAHPDLVGTNITDTGTVAEAEKFTSMIVEFESANKNWNKTNVQWNAEIRTSSDFGQSYFGQSTFVRQQNHSDFQNVQNPNDFVRILDVRKIDFTLVRTYTFWLVKTVLQWSTENRTSGLENRKKKRPDF